MIYFNPETSKKLEEMGLRSVCDRVYPEVSVSYSWLFAKEQCDEDLKPIDKTKNFNTLDICEIENAKKLWGEEDKERDELWVEIQKEPQPPEVSLRFAEIGWENRLKKYITLSDEDRVKYVEGYLTITSDK